MKTATGYIEAHICRWQNNAPEFLLLKRNLTGVYPGVWQMVTGKVNPGETGVAAALRETAEETGLTPQEMYVVPNINSFYSAFDDTVHLIPVFLMMVAPDAPVCISREHTEWKWVGEAEARELLAWPGQRKSVAVIVEYLTSGFTNLQFVKVQY